MDLSSDKNLISSKEAARITGYVSDYITRLCRQGKIDGEQVGRTWLIDRPSLLKFLEEDSKRKEENARELSMRREQEYYLAQTRHEAQVPVAPVMTEKPEEPEEVGESATLPVLPVPSPFFFEAAELPRVATRGSFAALALTLALVAGGAYAGSTQIQHMAIVAVTETATDMLALGTTQEIEEPHVGEREAVVEGAHGRAIRITVVDSVAIAEAVDESSSQAEESYVMHEEETHLSENSFLEIPSAIVHAIVGTSNAIMHAHEDGVYAWVDVTREIPSRTIAAVHGVGRVTTLFAAAAPAHVPAVLSDAENIALGVVGNLALAYDSTRDAIRGAYAYVPLAKNQAAATAFADGAQVLGTGAVATASALTPLEDAALFTYHAINSLFDGASNTFASLFAPKAPTPAPRPIVITSVTPISSSSGAVAYIPTGSTVVNEYTTVAGGVTMDEVIERILLNIDHTDDRVDERLEELEDELRDDLGGGGGSGSVTSIDASGGGTGLTFSGGPVTASGTLTLSGTLAPASGGTGQSSFAVGDILYADTTTTLAKLPAGSVGQVLKIAAGVPSWGTDVTGGGGAGAWATSTDNLSIYPSDTTDVVIVGASATTTTNNILEVAGQALFRNALTAYGIISAPSFTATTTAVNTFPTALFTNATTTSFGLNSETFTDLTGAGLTNTGGVLTLNATGDWTGTFDGQEGSYYLARANHTGTQLASTISDFDATARGLFSSTATGLTYTSGTGAFSLTSGYVIPLTASTTEWDTFYATPSSRISAANNLSWTGNTLGVAAGYVIPLTASTTEWAQAYASTTALSNSYIRDLFSSSVTGLSYDSVTGATTLTSGYTIPLTASSTEWNAAYSWGNHATAGYATFEYPFPGNATSTTLSFTGGLLSVGSTTISGNATTTGTFGAGALFVNNDLITDLTGTGLQNSGGVLTLNAAGDWMGTFDGQEGSYYLARANHTGTQAASTISDFNSAVQAFVHASTTIPKTYTVNTFTENNVFSGGLTLGTLNGPLQANNGVVSATTSIGVLYGGTGLTSAPSYGNLLVGNASGGYTLTATSSLGLQGTLQGTQGQVAYFSGTNTAAGTSSLFIATSGNVGMGTSSPGAKLTVQGDLQLNRGPGDDTAALYFGSMTGGATPTYVFGGNTVMTFAVNSAERMRIDSSGNVGIGTTTPVSLLSVGDNSAGGNTGSATTLGVMQRTADTVGVSIRSPLTNPQLQFCVSTGSFCNYIGMSTTTGSLLLGGYTGAGESASQLTITSAGNVGVGVTTPGAKLEVVANDINLRITGSSGGLRYYDIGRNSTTGFLDFTGVESVFSGYSFKNASNGSATTTLMTILNSGNVGIGTTSPVAKLGITGAIGVNATQLYLDTNARVGVGTAAPTSQLDVNQSGNTAVDLTIQNGQGIMKIGNPGNTAHHIWTTGAWPIGIGVSGALVTNWAGNGNFISNSFNSGGVFQITSADNTVTDLTVGNSQGVVALGASLSSVLHLWTTGAWPLQLGTNSTAAITILNGGNVGIGTTTPSAKFALTATGSVTGRAFVIANASNAEKFTILDNGNVGINVSGPGTYFGDTKLEIAANSTYNANADNALVITNETTPAKRLAFGYDSVIDAAYISSVHAGVSVKSLILNGAGGNVSIGTTTPDGRLQVYADSTATNGLHVTGVEQTGQLALFTSYINAANPNPTITVRGSRGTPVSPSAVQSGDSLMNFGARGYGATAFSSGNRARILMAAAENWTDSAQGTYMAFATTPLAGTTQTERMRIDSTGNVGIGTTTPYRTLSVNGSFALGGGSGLFYSDAAVQFLSPGGNAEGIKAGSLWVGSSYSGTAPTNGAYIQGNVGIGTTSPYANLSIHASDGGTNTTLFAIGSSTASATSSLFTVLNSGFVGIGTTTPSTMLSIFNTGSGSMLDLSLTDASTGTNPGVALSLRNRDTTDNNGNLINFIGTDTAGSALANARIGARYTSHAVGAMSGAIVFQTRNVGTLAERIRISAEGYLGIGTTTPWGQLSVNPNGLDAGVPSFVIGSSTATNFIVTQAGLVGIGTTTPQEIVSVESASTARFTVTSTLTNGSSEFLAKNGYGLQDGLSLRTFGPTFTTAGALLQDGGIVQARSGLTGGLAIGTEAAAPILFFTNGSAAGEKMRILSDGNVGIGDTSATARLFVNGSTAAHAATFYSNYQSTTGLSNYGLTIGGNRSGGNAEVNLIYGSSGAGLQFGSWDGATYTDRVIFDETGSVGIGTTTPSAKFALTATASGTGRAFVIANSSNAEKFTILDNGNVGIGSTSPNSHLVIHDTTYNNGTLFTQLTMSTAQNVWNGGAGSGNLIAWKGFNDSAVGALGGYGSDTNVYGLAFWGGANTGSPQMMLTNSGNFGLGTTTPSAKLDVHGAQPTGTKTAAVVGSQMFGHLNLTATDAASTQKGGRITFGGLYDSSGLYATYGAIQGAKFNATSGNSGGGLEFLTGNNATGAIDTRMTITHDGNVGIGTTSPWRTLSVTGTMAVTGLVNDSTGYYVCANTTSGQLATSTTACGASSEQFKKNIDDVTYGLDDLMQLRPVSFDYKDSYINDGPRQLGFIAEEVDLVIPELVARDADGNIKGLDYPKFTSVLAKAIQELNIKIEDLATTTEELAEDSFATRLFDALFKRITAWFGDASNGIANIFVGSVKAKDTVCVGETCVTEEQLKALLELAGKQVPHEEDPADELPEEIHEEPVEEDPPIEEPEGHDAESQSNENEEVQSSEETEEEVVQDQGTQTAPEDESVSDSAEMPSEI